MNTSQSIFLMNDQHRATDSEWYCLEARTSGSKSDVVAYSCILELRDRIKALEATQHAHVDLSHLSDAERERMLRSIANPGRFEDLEAAQPEHLIDPEREKAAQEFRQAAGFTPRRSESEGWHYIKDLYGKPADSSPQPNHPEIPGGSLKERIKSRMIQGVGSPWEVSAASVLVEVADWLNTKKQFDVAIELRVEAER